VGLVLAFGIFLILSYLWMRTGPIAPTIEVVVDLRPAANASAQEASGYTDLVLIHRFLSGHQDPPLNAEVQGGRRRWEIEEKWARSLLLAGDPKTLKRVSEVTIRLGRKTWRFPQATWNQDCPVWKDEVLVELPAGWQVRDLTATLPPTQSVIPSCRLLLNYPGDLEALVRAMLASSVHPAVLLILVTVTAILTARRWLPQRLRTTAALDELLADPVASQASEHEADQRRPWAWGLAGFALVIGCLTFLELRQPYYFVQDDNFSQFLPGMLAGCRAGFAGEMPDWNPYQYLGSPLAEVGTYALTYPVTYLSYALATYGLGDEYATMDVFCWLHLLAGYGVCFWLGRRLRLTAPTAAALGLCWSLSGYALIVGRSWYYMTPSYVGYPLLAIAALAVQRSAPSWRWILGTGLVIGLLFHAGNAQMWAYGLEFFGLWIVWGLATRNLPWSRLVGVGAALAVGLGLAAILLVPQFLATSNLDRSGGGGHDVLPGVAAILFPYPLAKLGDDARYWCAGEGVIMQLYYAGSVFSLAWLFGLILAAAFEGRGRTYWRNPLFALSTVALLLGLGKLGLLWPIQGLLPVFNKFGHALKYLPLFHLFALAMGAVLVERLAGRLGLSDRWLRGCFAVVALLMVYHVTLAVPSFYSYGDVPYPPLPKAMSDILATSEPTRIMPVCPPRSPARHYVFGLQHEFATIYRIDALTGYDPLVEKRPQFLRVAKGLEEDFAGTLRRYGTTHVVVHRLATDPQHSGSRLAEKVEAVSLFASPSMQTFCDRTEPILRTEDVAILKVSDPDPLAFPADDCRHALPLTRTPAALEVDVASLAGGGPVVINYLWYPRIRVTADGSPLDASADRFGRIQVDVPRGTRTLTVRYDTPWGLGLGVGVVLVALGAVVFGATRRFVGEK
jgi:hypothetical protein